MTSSAKPTWPQKVENVTASEQGGKVPCDLIFQECVNPLALWFDGKRNNLLNFGLTILIKHAQGCAVNL